jgi:hypothetical protein
MKNYVILFSALVLLCGCATMSTSTNPLAAQETWVAGAAWVSAVTDGVVLSGCVLGKFKPAACASYSLVRAELDRDLIVVSNLITQKATPAEVQTAIANAVITYVKIEAIYRGDYSVL